MTARRATDGVPAGRAARPADGSGAEAFVPQRRTIANLRRAARACRGCDLWAHATQTVFGEGPVGAELFLIGEQPGDREDQAGHPFVGPAGRILDQGLERAGIARERAYVTNAVKHFKWEQRGKRRIHQSPSRWEVTARPRPCGRPPPPAAGGRARCGSRTPPSRC